MIKRLSKALVTSLLIVCMMGGTVSAAPKFHIFHDYVSGGNPNISSWLVEHQSAPPCYEYHFVSEEFEYCTISQCTAKRNYKRYENILHSDCGLIVPRTRIY